MSVRSVLFVLISVFCSPITAAEADGTALHAIGDLLFSTSEKDAKLDVHISRDASFGAQGPGSLLAGLQGRSWSEPIASKIEHVTFFDAGEVHTLEKTFPNPMWRHIKGKIEGHQGVFVRFLTAESSALGTAPAGTPAMLVIVMSSEKDRPRVIHLSSDDEE